MKIYKTPQKYKVDKYFDDHYELNIKENLTLEEAKKLIYSLKSGVYVSYKVRKM